MTDMTKQTEAISTERALKLALEALEIERNVPRLGPVPTKTSKAITALREALTSVPDWASEAKEQPAPGRAHYEDGDVFERIAAMKKQPAPVAKPRKQEPTTVAELLCVCGAEWEWRNRDWELVAIPPAQRKPLTDEQIVAKALHLSGLGTSPDVIQFARAIEAAHGIKGDA